MFTEDERQQVGQAAEGLFGNGFHCAEAVAWAVLQAMKEDAAEAAAHATAFGGGFGRTFEEACGALSGALIAIGHCHGRRRPEGDWDLPANLGAMMREQFLSIYGTTCCATLRNRFGQDQQQAHCRRLIGKIAEIAVALLDESGADSEAMCCTGSVNDSECPCQPGTTETHAQ